jgi:hypothetical protein
MDLNKIVKDKNYRIECYKNEIDTNIIPKVKEIKQEELNRNIFISIPLSLYRIVKNYIYYDIYCSRYDKHRYNRFLISKKLWQNVNVD